jgi:hypothetical protein
MMGKGKRKSALEIENVQNGSNGEVVLLSRKIVWKAKLQR